MGRKQELAALQDQARRLEATIAALDQRCQAQDLDLAKVIDRTRERLDRLELEGRKVLNDAEALVQAAERKWRSARSAEERLRLRRRRESVEGDEDDDWPEELAGEDGDSVGAGSGGAPVPPVHSNGPPSPPADPTDVARAWKFRSS